MGQKVRLIPFFQRDSDDETKFSLQRIGEDHAEESFGQRKIERAYI
jgi:hypothetical protein